MTDMLQQIPQGALTARAPRYTSYPPATRFHEGVGAAEAEGWLRRIPPGARVSLYAHIPFCRRLCWFCACRTQGSRTGRPIGGYLDGLAAEVDLMTARLPSGISASHVHLGGGTPTFLSPRQIGRTFAMLESLAPLAPGAEVSVEVDPTELDEERLDALAACGVTRASLGVQDFDPRVQEAIGRAQSLAETRRAVRGLRARGIAAINLDLLYGLPHQSEAGLERTLRAALTLAPDRIALYGYAHVPWASRRQAMIREEDLPRPEARLGLARRAADIIVSEGFEAVGIDHFARPSDPMAAAARTGRLRRNFQGYTTDRAEVLIGLGASAISRLPGGYVQNAARTADWRARVGAGRLAAARGHALGAEDRFRGRVIERLLCDLALSPGDFPEPRRAEVAEMCRAAVADWPGIATRGFDGGLRLGADGRHVARLIAMGMDAYAAPEGRHSAAV